MAKLVERALVKDLLQIARADTMPDGFINSLIVTATEDAMGITRRAFDKKERAEFRQSYDQGVGDPEPQFLLVDAFPIDLALPLTLEYSPVEFRPAGSIVTLDYSKSDYTIEADQGKIVVRNASNFMTTGFYYGSPMFTYSPRGFRVTYTGGYAVSIKPEEEPVDPLDDYGVIQVDEGLKLVVANHVAQMYRCLRQPDLKLVKKDLMEDFRADLRPYNKKDMI